MWFDVQAAQAKLDPASGANRAKCANPQASFSTISTFSTLPEPETQKTECATRRAQEVQAGLPGTPPTCARCGVADWRVSVTEPDRRKLHIHCWLKERSRHA